MYRIKLYFSQSEPHQLLRTVVEDHLRDPGQSISKGRVCVRGKGGSERGPTASFQWTSAVKGLSYLLVLYSAMGDSESPEETAILEGQGGSIASSLDYAVSRQPLWIIDMFGLERSGRPAIRKILNRWNSDRSKGDVVALGINRNVVSADDIEVYLGFERVTQLEALHQLANCLIVANASEDRLLERSAASTISPSVRTNEDTHARELPNSQGILAYLRGAYIEEVSAMLRTTNVFNRSFLTASAQRLVSNNSFLGAVGKKNDFESYFELSLSASTRFGLHGVLGDARAFLNGEKPLRVVTAGTIAGTTIIFRYLTRFLGYNIDFSYQFAATNDIVDAIVQNSFSQPPDVCILGVLPAAPLFATAEKSEYSLIMMMPKASNRIISSAKQPVSRTFLSPEQGGSFIFCSDRPTSASFCFEELKREKIVSSKKVRVLHMEPHEVFEALKTEDQELRSILWFPHYQLNVLFNKCEIPLQPEIDLSLETLLFANQELCREKRRLSLLCVAVRDAWLDLQGSKELIGKVVDDLLGDEEYLKYLYRISGVFQSTELNVLLDGVTRGGKKAGKS
jgi:hypothetical protein